MREEWGKDIYSIVDIDPDTRTYIGTKVAQQITGVYIETEVLNPNERTQFQIPTKEGKKQKVMMITIQATNDPREPKVKPPFLETGFQIFNITPTSVLFSLIKGMKGKYKVESELGKCSNFMV